MTKKSPHDGSTLESLLRKDKSYEDSKNQAIKAVLAHESKKELLDQLNKLRNISEDYYSDFQCPPDQAFEEAEEFVRFLPIPDIPLPKIYVSDAGDIDFLWKRKDGSLHIDLGFYGDGTYSYYATNFNEQEFMDDAAKVCEGLPDSLIKMLTV